MGFCYLYRICPEASVKHIMLVYPAGLDWSEFRPESSSRDFLCSQGAFEKILIFKKKWVVVFLVVFFFSL